MKFARIRGQFFPFVKRKNNAFLRRARFISILKKINIASLKHRGKFYSALDGISTSHFCSILHGTRGGGINALLIGLILLLVEKETRSRNGGNLAEPKER